MISLTLILMFFGADPAPPPRVDPAPPPSTSDQACLKCHPPEVAAHLREWDRSVHARSQVTCSGCHRIDMPPKGDSPVARAEAITSMCGTCHADVETVFRASRHHQLASDKRAHPTCTTCHTTAGGNIFAGEELARRCFACHDKDRQHLEKRAIELLGLLRRVTLGRALLYDDLERLRRMGSAMPELEAALAQVDASYLGISLEWHRFDCTSARARSERALELLERAHQLVEDAR